MLYIPDVLKNWRRRDWDEASLETYADAYNQFGGSFITHPDVLVRLSRILELDLAFLARYKDGKIIGALPLWGKYIAGTKLAMRKLGRRDWVDMGNPEVILPLSHEHQFTIRYKVKFVSEKNRQQISNSLILPYSMGLMKSIRAGGFSSATLRNLRYQKRRMERLGCRFVSLSLIHPGDISRVYIDLMGKKWGSKPEGHERLKATLEALRPFIFGHMIVLEEQPVALRLAYFAESPQWVSYQAINYAADQKIMHLSPGSVLNYVNLAAAEEYASGIDKEMRYSIGKIDNDYKLFWSIETPVYRI